MYPTLSNYLTICLSVYHCLSIFLSFQLAIYLSICLSVYLSIYVVRTWCVFHLLPSKCASCQNGMHSLDIWTSKSGSNVVCFRILISTCASHHNGVHFFDISTSNSGPNVVCFRILTSTCASHHSVHFFDISTDFQKWSCFSHFDFEMRRPAFAFSTTQLPKVVRHWGVFTILASKCASRHNGVHFLIAHLATWLRTRHFSKPTFQPPSATKHWNNTAFHDFSWFFYLFVRLNLLSTDSFSSDSSLLWLPHHIPPLLLHLSISRKLDFQISFRNSF